METQPRCAEVANATMSCPGRRRAEELPTAQRHPLGVQSVKFANRPKWEPFRDRAVEEPLLRVWVSRPEVLGGGLAVLRPTASRCANTHITMQVTQDAGIIPPAIDVRLKQP